MKSMKGGPRIAATVKTNLKDDDVPGDFLRLASDCLVELFDTEEENVVVELIASARMCRAGSEAPMVNVDIRHNSNGVKNCKVKLAGDIAGFMRRRLSIPEDRTLVLFSDTRKST